MLWQGPSSALTPAGIRRTEEDDGCIYVLPMKGKGPLDLSGELTCDWRDGDLW
jgi:aminoglycoside 2'-N-acetyltransferase I